MATQPLVITPTYNEAENIRNLLDAILSLPSGFHVLIIDDNSPDKTAEIVEKHPEMGRRIFLLKRPKKMGLGTAYVTGFQWALDRGYPLILEMDADFSHNPNDLERLVMKAQTNDLVLGCRYMPEGGVDGWAKNREMLSRLANFYARMVLNMKYRDLTGGFKCFKNETLQKLDLKSIRSEGYAFQVETTFRVHQLGLAICEIPIIFKERRFGKSKISRKIIWEALFRIGRLAMSRF